MTASHQLIEKVVSDLLDQLRRFTVYSLVSAFILLLCFDVIDDFFLGNRWGGAPLPLYGLIGSIIAGLFVSPVWYSLTEGRQKNKSKSSESSKEVEETPPATTS